MHSIENAMLLPVQHSLFHPHRVKPTLKRKERKLLQEKQTYVDEFVKQKKVRKIKVT